MTIKLKQSTASQEVPLGYFVDDTDGKTAEIALTIANTDIKLWKMGAAALANKTSGGATHMAGGVYSTVLDATDTDTLGGLLIFVHVAGALPVRLECEVLAAAVYDALIGGTLLNDIADAYLNRDMSVGPDSGSATVRTPRQALRILRNKTGTSAGVMTVRKEDDTTTSWTAAVTTDAGAAPIVEIDPASA